MKFWNRLSKIQPTGPLATQIDRQRELLRVILLASWAALAGYLVWLGVTRSAGGSLTASLVAGGVFVAVWIGSVTALYIGHRVRLGAWALLVGFVFLATLVLPFEVLDRGMLIYAVPVALASFLLNPVSSLFFVLLDGVSYTLVFLASPQGAPYNFPAMLGLLALALAAWAAATVFERSHRRLDETLDETFSAWLHMLELRDPETERNTDRLTEMTLRVAHRLGVSASQDIHLRRGALLHDIGKLAIPDRVLLKTEPLVEDEYALLCMHSAIAYDLLCDNEYLRPALDIPYCHHEKFDGSGYPRGLLGEEIPLAARVFAVVDVWDALTSKRPFRPAWPEDKALAYIQAQPGKHFDPEVVEAFLAELELLKREQALEDATRK